MAEYLGPKLKEAVQSGKVPMQQIDEAARRVLYAEFHAGIVDDPPQKGVPDVEHGLEIAQGIAEKSIVLLQNKEAILPLTPGKVRSVAVIGGHADVGMISGGGSAQVDPPGGNVIMPPGRRATHWQDHVWFPTSPLKALQAKLPSAQIGFTSGEDVSAAEQAAKTADVAVVFAYQWQSEGVDLADLSLPDGQDQLIERVAAANPHTIVVLETGTAVKMPWAGKVQGIVEAWYAGSSGHKALANILTGEVNPSAKLAMTFPRSEQDLPHPVIPVLKKEDEGQGTGAVNGATHVASKYSVHYDEGSKVGYKWYQAERKPVLFPFGHGLSYTSYEYSSLKVDANGDRPSVQFTVKNTGTRAGTEIAQVYVALPGAAGERFNRLAGWQRIELNSGESKVVAVPLDTRVLQVFEEPKNAFRTLPGNYRVSVGASSAETPLTGSFRMR